MISNLIILSVTGFELIVITLAYAIVLLARHA